MPEKIDGSAAGNSTRRKIAARSACRVRIIRRYSGSTDWKPSRALTVIGKKQTSATITHLRRQPEAEVDDQHRGDRHHRHALARHQQRVDRAPRRRRTGAARPPRPARTRPPRRSRRASRRSVYQGGGRELAALVHQRPGDVGGRGQQVVRAPRAGDVRLPGEDRTRPAPPPRPKRPSSQRLQQPAARLRQLCRRVAVEPSRLLVHDGGRARPESTSTRSHTTSASSTSWVTSTTVRGS